MLRMNKWNCSIFYDKIIPKAHPFRIVTLINVRTQMEYLAKADSYAVLCFSLYAMEATVFFFSHFILVSAYSKIGILVWLAKRTRCGLITLMLISHCSCRKLKYIVVHSLLINHIEFASKIDSVREQSQKIPLPVSCH